VPTIPPPRLLKECQAPDCSRRFPEFAGRKWCSEECRKRTKYGGTCKGCGARTNGSAGPGKAADYCNHCRPGMRKRWNEDTIIQAMLNWHVNHGEQPRSTQWMTTDDGSHPTTSTVLNVFGSWNNAIRAVAARGHAGFYPRKPGRYATHADAPPSVRPPRRPRPKAKPKSARIPASRPEPAPTIQTDSLRHGRPVHGAGRRRQLFGDTDLDDHSTNTPAENRARVAKAQAGKE
jgi:hypothetical protein